MTEAKKHDPNDPIAEYGRVVDNAELSTVSLVSLNFAVHPSYFEKQEEIQLGYEINVSEHNYNTEQGSVLAVVECSVSANVDDEPLFKCDASYVVGYALSQECDIEAVSAFVKRVGVFACYPYFRSIVANVDWAAGTHLPPMPVHREVKAPAPNERKAKKRKPKS